MASSVEPHLIVERIIESIYPGQLSDDNIQALHRLFQSAFIAALDLIDRGSVIRWKTPWGRVGYEVAGSGDTYRVFLAKDLSGPPDHSTHSRQQLSFCSCPAFAIYVLKARTQIMCKHLLAVRLAERLNKTVERNRKEDDLVPEARHAPS